MNTFKLFFFMVLCSTFTFAQVGVNIPTGSTVDASAAFEIQSGSSKKGLLTPRMKTAERLSIVTPADGLIVYDTDLKSFYYYKTDITGPPAVPATWNRMTSEATGRLNFKRIKSTDVLATVLAAEKTAGGNAKYLLDPNTYYEINGTINLDLPIGINNAYIVGLDANEDKLVKTSGNLFDGTKGGTIKNLTITASGGNAFSLTGTATENLLIRDCIIAGCSNVGTISGYGLVFASVVQFAFNTNGITYSNIGNLLLDNQAWLDSNNGTFEKFTGVFALIEKNSGFSTVNGADIAMDVSDSSLSVGTGVLEGTVFSGTTSSPTGYVKENSTTAYSSYNFTNAWSVDAPGIPRESDDLASGNLYFNSASVTTITTTTPLKLPVNTDATRLFRTSEGAVPNSENRLIYRGESKRAINVIGSISFTATGGSRYAFSIYKNNIKVVGSDVIVDIPTTNDRQSVSIIGTVDVAKNDYLEIFLEKGSTNISPNQFLITSYNLIFN